MAIFIMVLLAVVKPINFYNNPRYLYFTESDLGKVRKFDLQRHIIKTVYRHPAIRGCSLIGSRMVVTGSVLAELK